MPTAMTTKTNLFKTYLLAGCHPYLKFKPVYLVDVVDVNEMQETEAELLKSSASVPSQEIA